MKTNALVLVFVGLVACKSSEETARDVADVVGQIPGTISLYGTDCVAGVDAAKRRYESLADPLEELRGDLPSLDDAERQEMRELVKQELRFVPEDEFKQACPHALPVIDELVERAMDRAGLAS